MAGKVKAIPDGYEGAMPYMCCKGCGEAIEFYKRAFGAEEIMRMGKPDGTVGHAEIRIGRAIVMLADECAEIQFLSPKTVGGTPVSVYIYVEDVDALHRRATAAGVRVVRPLQDQFYGDRSVGYEDPFGHRWGFATHKEDLTPEEIGSRAKKAMGG